MKFRLQAPSKPKTFGAMDEDGRVWRLVWKVIKRSGPRKDRPYYVAVMTVHRCGHIIVKKSEQFSIWRRVRCRMCEKTYQELQAETDRMTAAAEKKRQKELAHIRKLMDLQRKNRTLMIRVPSRNRGPRKRKPLSASPRRTSGMVSSAVGGRGVILIPSNRQRTGHDEDD